MLLPLIGRSPKDKGSWTCRDPSNSARGDANVKSCPSIIWCCITLLTFGTGDVHAEAFKTIKTTVSLEACLKTVLGRRPGKVVKVEYKTERHLPIYEFEIAAADGKTWEIECEAFDGNIVEEEQEVESAGDAIFKAKARIAEEDARQVALKAHPGGTVIETEYEIESNGDASYEFDVQMPDGAEIKLEVDATTGKITEDEEEELYQIGQE